MRYLWLFIIFINGLTFAQQVDQKALDEPKNAFCPPLNQLVRDEQGGKWSAPGGWYTVTFSFGREVTGFNGAIFSGQTLGTVSCIYSVSNNAPKITLFNTQLISKPTSKNWASKDRKLVCSATQVSECPFVPFKANTSDKDLNQMILDLPKR
ncbi:MAG: hypothetical protein CMF41_02595 [Legionellales bacterium]|nr:hypothetical protein [Legionellales bacterium]|tara:strand:- start:2233 stop:2688 length:456 start_codon:yes stop_codon:yes gene_type:complete